MSGLDDARAAIDESGPGWSWGFPALDDTLGLIRPGRLHFVGARPSCGKTTFFLNWLNFSFLGPSPRPAPRCLAFFTEQHPATTYRAWAALRHGHDQDAVLGNDWRNLPAGARDDIEAELLVFEYLTANLAEHSVPTLAAIRDEISAAQDRMGGVDIVLFDFLQRVRPSASEHKFEAWGNAATEFAALAVREKIAVLAGTQLRREDTGVFDKYRPPTLSSGKGASEIEEGAHVYLGLFRPLLPMTAAQERGIRDGFDDLERFKERDTMAVKVLKHRTRGAVADRILRLDCRDGRLAPYTARPTFSQSRGDAWEP